MADSYVSVVRDVRKTAPFPEPLKLHIRRPVARDDHIGRAHQPYIEQLRPIRT